MSLQTIKRDNIKWKMVSESMTDTKQGKRYKLIFRLIWEVGIQNLEIKRQSDWHEASLCRRLTKVWRLITDASAELRTDSPPVPWKEEKKSVDTCEIIQPAAVD